MIKIALSYGEFVVMHTRHNVHGGIEIYVSPPQMYLPYVAWYFEANSSLVGNLSKYSTPNSSSSTTSSSSSISSHLTSPISYSLNNSTNPTSLSKQEDSLSRGGAARLKDSRSVLNSPIFLFKNELGHLSGDDGFAFSIVKNGIVK
ncbi:hypothetical protein Tco_0327255 [Tanacetum coccineum]